MHRYLSACVHFGRVAALTLFLLTTAPCASAADLVRGVSPSKQALYVNGIDCTPRDGALPSLATIHVPRSRINDDYCDCADGRDEPGGESACEEARFFCANAGHRSGYIPSAFVGDGTCDCCDGSDEIPGVCRDDCSVRGEAARKDAEKLAEGIMRGVGKRARMAKEGKELVKKDQKDIDGLRRTKAVLVKKVDAAEVIANRLRSARDRAEKVRNEKEAASTVSAGITEPETKGGLDLEIESGEESFGLESSEEEENYDFDAPAVDSGYGDGTAKSGKENEDDGAASPADGEGSDAVSGDIDSDALCAELAENTGSNRLVNSAKYYQALLVNKLQRILPPFALLRLGVRSDAGITGCVLKAEGQERSLRDEMTEAQRSITKLESVVSLDYGSDSAMRPLHGKCIKQTFAQYEFELCNFDAIRQYERSSVIARLGSWGKWEDSETGTKRVMLYENGDQCWNGPKRSVRVSLECGDKNEIVSVDEPNRCAYSMRFKTPAVCDAAMADAARKVSSDDDVKYEL